MTNQTIDGVPGLHALLDAHAYPNRLCHTDYTTHPYICGCLKGDEEAQRRFDEHQAKAAQLQGSPVAVVLPERGLMEAPTVNRHLGWNASTLEYK
jgi:hypothetical protein